MRAFAVLQYLYEADMVELAVKYRYLVFVELYHETHEATGN